MDSNIVIYLSISYQIEFAGRDSETQLQMDKKIYFIT